MDAKLHFAALVALLAGVLAGFALPGLAGDWPLCFSAAAIVVCAAHGWRAPKWLFAAVFLAGAGAALRDEAHLESLLRPPPSGPARQRILELEVKETVSARPGRCSFRSETAGVSITAVAKLPPGAETPAVGERWRCRGWLSPPPPERSRFSAYRLWVTEEGAAERIAPARGSAARRAALRADLERRVSIGIGEDPQLVDVRRAILLGSRASIPERLRRTFVDAGTVHVFAISGLHVMVVAGLCAFLLVTAGMRRDRVGLAAIPIVAAYAALTGAKPSAVRAAIMAGFWFMGPLIGRRRDLVTAWALTAIIVYAARPHLVFDVGCTFSFTVMLGIALWLRLAGRLAEARGPARVALPAEDPEGGAFARMSAWTRRRVKALPRTILSTAAVSAAAWAAGVPVAASTFGRFTPGGLVANVAVIPLATVTVVTGMAGIAASYVCDALAIPFDFVSSISARGMVLVSELVAGSPLSSMEVEPWGVWKSVAWYFGWIAAGAALRFFISAPRLGAGWMKRRSSR